MRAWNLQQRCSSNRCSSVSVQRQWHTFLFTHMRAPHNTTQPALVFAAEVRQLPQHVQESKLSIVCCRRRSAPAAAVNDPQHGMPTPTHTPPLISTTTTPPFPLPPPKITLLSPVLLAVVDVALPACRTRASGWLCLVPSEVVGHHILHSLSKVGGLALCGSRTNSSRTAATEPRCQETAERDLCACMGTCTAGRVKKSRKWCRKCAGERSRRLPTPVKVEACAQKANAWGRRAASDCMGVSETCRDRSVLPPLRPVPQRLQPRLPCSQTHP